MGKFLPETAPAWAQRATTEIAQALSARREEIFGLAVAPPRPELGDLAIPLFQFAKAAKVPPPALAKRLQEEIGGKGFRLSVQGPYLNVHADRGRVMAETLAAVTKDGKRFGHQPVDPEKVAVIDYSSPNIAKPLAFHHIRSTMIGNSIARILRASGYTVHGVNHIGDWGTQFGYLIAAHENDSPEVFARLSLDDFTKTYVEERQKAKVDPSIDERARAAFLRLEQGDASARRVWQRARDASLERFKQIYARLGVHFDEDKYIGESFFEKDLPGVIAECETKGIAKESDGALIVDLSAAGIDTPCLLRKSDGATLYATRDIATAKYRHDRFGGTAKRWQALYVVDQGQALHFRQVFKVMELLGYDYASQLIHVPFGVLLLWSDEEQGWIKGKTRSGHIVLLEDVLDEAKRRVLAIINERSPELAGKDSIAEAIGIGAVVFNDLKNKRTGDVKFKLSEALSLEGETGPYIHNALVRTKSILRKAGRAVDHGADLALLTHAREGELAMLMAAFADTVQRAAVEYEPSLVARYLLDLAGAFHAFHHDCLVLDPANPALSHARLWLTSAVMQVLENGMDLIGLQSIPAM